MSTTERVHNYLARHPLELYDTADEILWRIDTDWSEENYVYGLWAINTYRKNREEDIKQGRDKIIKTTDGDVVSYYSRTRANNAPLNEPRFHYLANRGTRFTQREAEKIVDRIRDEFPYREFEIIEEPDEPTPGVVTRGCTGGAWHDIDENGTMHA